MIDDSDGEENGSRRNVTWDMPLSIVPQQKDNDAFPLQTVI